MRLTGEGVLEEEWMTDICISFWDVKSLEISIYLQTEQGMCPHHLSSPLNEFVYIFFHPLSLDVFLV